MIKLKFIWSHLSVLLVCIFMTACAAGVKRQEGISYYYKGEKYSKVNLTVDSSATKDLDDLESFDEQMLQETIMSKLKESGFVDKASPNIVKVVITDLRLRSSFNAFFWGELAGADYIIGDVSLVGNNGQTFNEVNVSVYYAFGGVFGQDEIRMKWLYKEFSNRILSEIKGKP